jgi:hypothetical protein
MRRKGLAGYFVSRCVSRYIAAGQAVQQDTRSYWYSSLRAVALCQSNSCT